MRRSLGVDSNAKTTGPCDHDQSSLEIDRDRKELLSIERSLTTTSRQEKRKAISDGERVEFVSFHDFLTSTFAVNAALWRILRPSSFCLGPASFGTDRLPPRRTQTSGRTDAKCTKVESNTTDLE